MNLLKNKYFILGNIILLLAVIPLTLFVVKSQTNLRSKATPSTTLSLSLSSGSSASVAVGSSTSFDIFVDPGQNIISIIDMTIQVANPDQITITSLTVNDTAFPVKLKNPTVSSDGSSVSMSVSATTNSTSPISAKTKVGTLTVKGKAPTNGTGSIIKFDRTNSVTQVFSLAAADGSTENVLSDAGTTSVTVTGTASIASNKPTCSALTLDRSASGNAPYSITFTGTGTASSGAISRATFNFGDSTSQEVTTAGGIGTNSVNVQISHTYTIPGSYNATLTLTDNTNNVSDATTSCTKAITINTAGSTGSGGGTGGGTGATATPTATLAPIAIPTAVPVVQNPAPAVPATGSVETTFAILGGVGVSLIIGALLFVL